jgi:histidinol-phosphate aminotransferase
MPKSKNNPKSRTAAPGWSPAQVLKLARQSIQAIKPYVPGKSIAEVKEAYHPKVITKLGSNENPLGSSRKVVAAWQASAATIHLYPDGSNRHLRRGLADTHGLQPENIFVGNGSDEVLFLIAAAFLNPGEPVLVSEHTFSEYEFSGRVMDGKIVKIPLDAKLRYDLSAFRKNLRPGGVRPKLVFLCNPNNPTGSYFTHQELADFLRAVPRDTLVVVDEAYCEYATAPDFPRSLELLAAHPNLILCRTFSKIFGMAGARLGYALAHPLLIKEIARVRTPFSVNQPAQSAALAALSDKAFVKKSRENNARGCEFLSGRFRARGIEFLPTQTNFICFRTDRIAAEFCEDLLKLGMIIRPLRSFGLDYWNRVTIGTPEQNRRFIDAVDSVLGSRGLSKGI